jgi:nitroimidazol reductase NimA-like FMN-containing flavoprotein (pyridoxamine 5'-phosphate oxidase superfamily)
VTRDIRDTVRRLLGTQRLGVLGTQSEGQPYSSLVAVVPADDLKHILFATAVYTRKYANLKANDQVSLLIDNRGNVTEDFHEGMAVTVLGRAVELENEELDKYRHIYLARHPFLDDFVSSPTCSLFKVQVRTYYLVTEFQNVTALYIRP